MRLTCPNCGAQYEVPDAVIPQAGRDVQCSNCGDTWFQAHPGAEEASGAARVTPRRPPRAPETPPRTEPETPPATEAASEEPDLSVLADEFAEPPAFEVPEAAETQATAAEESFDDPDDGEDNAPAAAAPAPRRRELDPSIRDVLRQEAEHEARVRARESGALESQPELGLADPESESDRREREARARMARLRGGATAPAEDGGQTSRRDLLPDIEEINSSLRSRGHKVEEEDVFEAPDPVARRSFRRGFTLPIFLGAISVLLYLNAPRIAERFPQAEPAMRSYVGTVDEGRVWLDVNVRRLIVWIEEKTGSEA